jgi:hypothetical protein
MSPSFKIPRNRGEKLHFKNFSGPQKIVGHRGKIQMLSPVHHKKKRKEFLDKPVLQNLKTLQKNPCFEIFLGPLKIARNRLKIQNFKTCTFQENRVKIQI